MSKVNSFSYSLIFNSAAAAAAAVIVAVVAFFRTSHSHLDSQSYTPLHKNLFSCSGCVSFAFAAAAAASAALPFLPCFVLINCIFCAQ